MLVLHQRLRYKQTIGKTEELQKKFSLSPSLSLFQWFTKVLGSQKQDPNKVDQTKH